MYIGLIPIMNSWTTLDVVTVMCQLSESEIKKELGGNFSHD